MEEKVSGFLFRVEGYLTKIHKILRTFSKFQIDMS